MGSEHDQTRPGLHAWFHIRSALLGIILVCTLVLNSLLVAVLRKMKSRRSNKDCASYNIEKSYMYLLFHLAFADMLGVILNIPFDIFSNAEVEFYYSEAGCKLLGPFQLASTSAQAGTYVALSYHRFRAIVHPIRANLTVCKSILMIGVVWSISVCLSLPYFLVLRLDENNACGEEWPQGNTSSIIYTFSIFVVQYAAPVALMALFYISIARTLHEHRIAKELVHVPTQDDVRSHRHIVKMLVTIVTVYAVCMLPHHLIWIIDGFHPMDETNHKIISSISYLFTYSNSVANPVIFFLYNKESRYHLKRFLIRLCSCHRDMDVPFEIKKWSATWSANSKTDSTHQQEKRASKGDQLKLNQLFPTKPGDSSLGVSLPWEAQVVNSIASTEEGPGSDTASPPVPDPFLVTCSPPGSDTASPPAPDPFLAACSPTIFLTEPDECIPLPAGSESQYPNEPAIVVTESEDPSGNPENVSPNLANDENDEEDEGCVDVESNSSEDETKRVQSLIKDMMDDITHEMKEDMLINGMNGVNLDDLLQFTDSSSNGECDAVDDAESDNSGLACLGKFSSSQDLIKEMISFLESSPHATERDICVMQEHLRNLPETRM